MNLATAKRRAFRVYQRWGVAAFAYAVVFLVRKHPAIAEELLTYMESIGSRS